ncbi:MAG: hypothetical protein AB7E95_07020 [Kiritimatiellales bacterium]
MKIDELHSAMIDRFKSAMPKLATAQKYFGRFNTDELDAISVKTPALLLSFLGGNPVTESGNGEVSILCQFSAFFVTTDQRGLPRDTAAQNLCEATCLLLPDNRFEVKGVGAPEKIAQQNLFSIKARTRAVTLCAVTWNQRVQTGTDVFAEDGTLPDTVYARIDGEQTEIVGNE